MAGEKLLRRTSTLTAGAIAVALGASVGATAHVEAAADDAPCPADMRLVEGDHWATVEQECENERDGRCFGFVPGVVRTVDPKEPIRTCMDAFEAPNVKGGKPIVMKTAPEAEEWCKRRGRRLCREAEWETACEGAERRPFVYGWKQDNAVCNSGKAWRSFSESALRSHGEEADAEVARLWQGEPAGSRARCVSKEGVYDLIGNVEEWVASSPGRAYRTTLKGGFWAKPWTNCRGSNDAHDPQFRFYEVGFRCCSEPTR